MLNMEAYAAQSSHDERCVGPADGFRTHQTDCALLRIAQAPGRAVLTGSRSAAVAGQDRQLAAARLLIGRRDDGEDFAIVHGEHINLAVEILGKADDALRLSEQGGVLGDLAISIPESPNRARDVI